MKIFACDIFLWCQRLFTNFSQEFLKKKCVESDDDNALLRHTTHFVSWTLEVLRLRMLELEVVPEHGLISDVVEFILGKVFLKMLTIS